MPKPLEKKPRFRYRFWFAVAGFVLAFASTAWASKSVRNFLAADSRFVLRRAALGSKNQSVQVTGATYVPAGRVQQVFADDFGHSIFLVDIAERRRRLLAVDWIADASVSRVWPNQIYVRVRERKPVAFVSVPRHGFLLVDAEGVLLSPPGHADFPLPILNGISIDQSESDRRLHVEAAERMLDDLGPVAKDVSEVNAAAIDDLRVTAAIEGRAVELWLGDGNFGQRYRNFLDHYADIRSGSPRASVFDLRIDDRITAK